MTEHKPPRTFVASEGCSTLYTDAGTDGCSRRNKETPPCHSCRTGPGQSRSTPRIGPTSSGAPRDPPLPGTTGRDGQEKTTLVIKKRGNYAYLLDESTT